MKTMEKIRQIRYKKHEETYHYLSYSISTDQKDSIKLYFVDYNEGILGDNPDSEVFITANESDLLIFIENINSNYPIDEIDGNIVILDFLLKENKELKETVQRISRMLNHVAFSMGLGILDSSQHKLIKNESNDLIRFEIKITFHKKVIDYINEILKIDSFTALIGQSSIPFS